MNEIFSQLLRVRYESLLASWSKSNNFEEFDNNFVEDAKIIEKDSRRTDRTSDFFSDENIHNVQVLERLLKTFALLRPEIGYVQGMSDIMALPLMVLNNEHQTFWCFDSIMKTVQGRVFADLTLSEPLENLAKLCRHVEKPLFDHLDHIYEGDQWLFAYRLVLLNFKRELFIDGCSRLWEEHLGDFKCPLFCSGGSRGVPWVPRNPTFYRFVCMRRQPRLRA
jgi:hypothetical protein